MKTTQLNQSGEQVSALGLGAMPLSIQGRPSEAQAIRVIHRAIDLGVTFIDTADSYCLDETDKHHNERLIARALAGHPQGSQIKVATKGGLLRPNGDWVRCGDPQHLAKTIRDSHHALGGTEPVFLWQLHTPDPQFSLEETLQAVVEAVDAGLIRHVGLSNVSVEEIQHAQKILPIVSVQNKFNPWHRQPERDGVLPYCEENGLTFLPWSPLGGHRRVRELPQFKGLAQIAADLEVSPARLVLAWMLAKSPVILPIPGATRLESLEDSMAAVTMNLSGDQVAEIDSILD
jgi:aryl-alcohol dehydrogenase-like predicted oxidoreductase